MAIVRFNSQRKIKDGGYLYLAPIVPMEFEFDSPESRDKFITQLVRANGINKCEYKFSNIEIINENEKL
jgi:hypothetical protein